MNYENMSIAELQAEKEKIDRTITKKINAERLKKYTMVLRKAITDIENASINLYLVDKGADKNYEIDEIYFDSTNNEIIISIY